MYLMPNPSEAISISQTLSLSDCIRADWSGTAHLPHVIVSRRGGESFSNSRRYLATNCQPRAQLSSQPLPYLPPSTAWWSNPIPTSKRQHFLYKLLQSLDWQIEAEWQQIGRAHTAPLGREYSNLFSPQSQIAGDSIVITPAMSLWGVYIDELSYLDRNHRCPGKRHTK